MSKETSHFWQSPYIEWQTDVPAERDILIFKIRNARIKAKVSAIVEACNLLVGLEPQALSAGPGAGEKGIFWLSLPREHIPAARERFKLLGYTRRVSQLLPAFQAGYPQPEDQQILWKKQACTLRVVYDEDAAALRAAAPDKRNFILRLLDGSLQPTPGYRGDGFETSRRGLPVYDARLLVNLVRSEKEAQWLLEPFGGVGGVVLEAAQAGYRVVSMDIDRKLMNGLQAFGGRHLLGDAQHLPLLTASLNAVASEPPYHPQAHSAVLASIAEMQRVLAPGGKIALLCAAWQTPDLLAEIEHHRGKLLLKEDIDRKGTDCSVIAWQKTAV